MLAVCLNPAWQKTLLFEVFSVGAVNRATRLYQCGGGKGVNVARALRTLGDQPQVALFVGGPTGDQLLAELNQDGIGAIAVTTQATTRTCITIIDELSGQVTEVIEPTASVRSREMAEMTRQLREAVLQTDGVALCGTFPPGVPESCYASIIEQARDAGRPTLLDGYQRVHLALHAGPTVLKLNADELRHLSGRSNLEDGAFECLTQYPLQILAVTDGPQPAFLFTRHASWQFDQPVIEVRNAIGAGDCASAILLRELIAGQEPQDAFRAALAAANASCLTDLPASFRPEDAKAFHDRIEVRKL